MVAPVEHATIGALRLLGIPVKLSETPGAVRTAPPTLGQHTASVLTGDLGLDRDADRRASRAAVSSDGSIRRPQAAPRDDRPREARGAAERRARDRRGGARVRRVPRAGRDAARAPGGERAARGRLHVQRLHAVGQRAPDVGPIGARISSRSSLDTSGAAPQVVGRVSRSRGRRVLETERPLGSGPVRDLTETDVLAFLADALEPFVER